MCFLKQNKSVSNTLNWTLIFISCGFFIAYTTCVSSERQRNLYAKDPKYQQSSSQDMPYNNRYRQGGQDYINRNQPQNYQEQNSQQQNPAGGSKRPIFNITMDKSQHRKKYWVPIDLLDKYIVLRKFQVDSARGLQLIEMCEEGYGPISFEHSDYYCRPLCDNCQNGICIAPNECQCHEEFVKNDNDDCVFTCPMGCLNGKCYLDGTCQCDPGYKLDETRKFCRPICSGGCGFSGKLNCTEPEVCGCSKGFRLTDLGCVVTCEPDCGRGTCTAPNICECDPGITKRNGICQQDCYQQCDNGVCYGRNRCICNPGFTYHERSTQCVPV